MDAAEHERWWRERGAAELRRLLYEEWDPIGRDRFAGWMERHVLGTRDFAEYLESVHKKEAVQR